LPGEHDQTNLAGFSFCRPYRDRNSEPPAVVPLDSEMPPFQQAEQLTGATETGNGAPSSEETFRGAQQALPRRARSTRIVFSSLTTASVSRRSRPCRDTATCFFCAPAIRRDHGRGPFEPPWRRAIRRAARIDRRRKRSSTAPCLKTSLIWFGTHPAMRRGLRAGAVVKRLLWALARRRPHDRPGGGGIQRGSARLRNRSWDKWVELPRAADWRPHSQR